MSSCIWRKMPFFVVLILDISCPAVCSPQIEEELVSLQKERTDRIKHLLERQERETDSFDMESVRLGFGNLGTLDVLPKDDYR